MQTETERLRTALKEVRDLVVPNMTHTECAALDARIDAALNPTRGPFALLRDARASLVVCLRSPKTEALITEIDRALLAESQKRINAVFDAKTVGQQTLESKMRDFVCRFADATMLGGTLSGMQHRAFAEEAQRLAEGCKRS